MADPTTATIRAHVPLWARVVLPLVVLGVALLIGSGAFDSSPQTVAQRAAAIEAGVRCPACTDVSVAQSNSTTAIAVRHQIESLVAAGSSDADIDQTLVSEYGQTILLVPPDAGGFPLIWVIPLVLGVATIGAVGVLFWRRTRAFDALRQHEVVS
ncbi:MAG TPA: cytochrome c-type biogenesis protein CcmH [Acidimicrobiales bacterium]|jgi:cytochrome c-type biogenesis protein CcmH|nr:cytochrome c-type biogenesis protein CcmH [Acidimicrobiales bacterium]